MPHRKTSIEEGQQDKTSVQNSNIQQLWYTWSDVGLDTIRAGFRIRAASEGLSDIIDEHVKNLDRYQRYSLPQDANPATSLKIAPVCLSFIVTEQERILVHKEYTGKDAVGRYGVFFIHLLDNLPENFSARDAILLWGLDFWQNSDASLRKKDPFSTSLPPISCENWEKWINSLRKERDKKPWEGIDIDPQHAQWIEKQLSYLVWTYLIKKPYIDSATELEGPEQIYIAAPDNDIALLISGLTHGLPEQLVKNLTFSTYESDVAEATTEIVGTCWLSVPGARQDPHVASLLPDEYYYEKLAMNCYTGWQTQIENHPLVKYRPFAQQCAQHAVQYFLYGDMEYEAFLDDTKESPNLTIDEFLRRYEREIVRAQDPSREDIEAVLSSFDDLYAARMLSKEGYRKGVLKFALSIPEWWSDFASTRLENLHQRSKGTPKLAQALSRLARYALPYAVNIARAGVVQADVPAPQETLTPAQAFAIIIELISTIAPPEADPHVWIALLESLRTIPNVFVFLNRYWNFYAKLMGIWARLLPLPLSEKDYKLVHPLLSPLSWDRFGDFLALNFPLDWNERVTATLVSQSPSLLNRDIVSNLEQKFHPFIENLLRQLSQDSRLFSQQGTIHQLPKGAQPWSTAAKLFKILVASHYGQKLSLLFLLLDSAMGQQENNVERLLKDAQLSVFKDVVALLKRYGSQYLPSSGKNAKTILRMFDELAKSDDPLVKVSKMDVLLTWLASHQLSHWLDLSPIGEEHLAMLLTTARMDVKESEEFFRRYGQKYIRLYPWSATLIDLFDRYARTPGDLRMHLLFIWLNLPLQQSTFEQVLWAAHLQKEERIRFIEQYGELHLSHYPESQVLLNYVLKYLEYIQTADIDIFLNDFSPEMPSAPERFLWFLFNWTPLDPSPKPMIYNWYLVANFVRKPAFLNKDITESIGRLLNTPDIPAEKRDKLIKRFAVACIENEQVLIYGMHILYGMLTPLNPLFWQTLQEIAESARDGIRERRYARTLYIAIIHFALTFKTVFPSEATQEDFVQDFLETLLQGISQKTFKWLNSEAKKWPVELATGWQRYRAQLYLSAVFVPPSLFERGRLWWERTVALNRMRRALSSKQLGKIADASIDYMTTLSSYDDDVVPQQWRLQIDEALKALNMREEARWQQYDELERHQTYTTSVPPKQAISAHTNVVQSSRSQQVRLQQIRRVAFREMDRALKSRKIGRIVRVSTNHMMTLETYAKEVPNKWWWQIGTTTDFYLACEEANESIDEAKEQGILTAANAIADLARARIPAPKLTAHEKRRVESAKHYIVAQQAQRARIANRQQMLLAQPLSGASGTAITMEPTSNEASRPIKQSLFGRFRWFGKGRKGT